jgi:hypothetical protein
MLEFFLSITNNSGLYCLVAVYEVLPSPKPLMVSETTLVGPSEREALAAFIDLADFCRPGSGLVELRLCTARGRILASTSRVDDPGIRARHRSLGRFASRRSH